MKCIRITQDNDDAIKELCADVPCIVCKEGPDNEKNCRKVHYHLMLDSDLSDNGLRKQIYKYFNVPKEDHGQKTCAFTQVKCVEGLTRYICKGLENTKPEIILNTLEINVDKYYGDFWDIFQTYKDKGDRDRKEAKSRTQEFMDYFDDNYNKDNRAYGVRLTLPKVCDIMVDWYKTNNYLLPTKWQGTQLVRTCYVRYSEEKEVSVNMRRFYDAEEW